MKELEQTFKIEISRLYEAAKEGPLDVEQTNKLVKLTSALKNYLSSPLDDEETDYEGAFTHEELLELARVKVTDED
jgi:hypothetical protein